MKCAACRPLLSKYVDGEASPAEVRLIEEHIGGCARCTAALTEFRLMRTTFHQAPQHPPDPRIRAGLLKAIEEIEMQRPADARLRRPAPRQPARPAPRRAPSPAWSWLGNLAGAAAIILVVGTSFLLVNIGRQQRPAVGTPASTAQADLSTVSVPTQPAVALSGSNVPGAETTPGAPPLAEDPTALAMPRTATGTPVWHMADEKETAPDGHAIQDSQFGYQLTYPANGWSAPAPATGEGVLGRRLVAPWSMESAQATVPFYMIIDVLTGTATIPVYTQTVSYNNWQGTRGTRQDGTQRIDEIYLRQGRLLYRFDTTLDTGGASTTEGTGWATAILQSFRPAADLAQHPFGYAPALALRNGDLWAVNPDGSNLRQMTTSGMVRAFSLAPDLHQVALVTALRREDTWGAYVELLDLAQAGAPRRIWTAKEIHEVAWNGTQELVAIGIDQSGALGLYNLNRNLGGTDHLSTLPNGNAHNLQVAPDRTWVGFLSDTGSGASELYGVRPDGSGQTPIMPRTGGTNGITRDVREFAWMPATVAAPESGTESLVVLEKPGADTAVLPEALRLPAPTSGQSPSVTRLGTTDTQQARYLTVSPQGQVAYALFQGDAWRGLQTCTMADGPTPGAGHCGAVITVGTKPSAMQWAPDGTHLLVESQAPGHFDLQRLDPATRTTAPLMHDAP